MADLNVELEEEIEQLAITLNNPVYKGEQGNPGADGYSPKVTITDDTSVTPNTHTITVTDAEGTQSAVIKDGVKGDSGSTDYNELENKPTLNGKTIQGDVTLDIPSKTSELTNDSNFAVDSNYVHTDNNYTTAEKTKLSELENYDDTSVKKRIKTIEDDYLTSADKTSLETEISGKQPAGNYSVVTETGNKIELSMDSTTYEVEAKLYDKNNNLLSTSSKIDLPLESLILNVEYDATKKALIITLKDGTTKEVPVSDLVSGLVNETTFNTEMAKKVDKVEGKSLILDTEIARLSDVHNYDDTSIQNRIKTVEDDYLKESDKTELETSIDQKVDKVTGKQLSTEDYTTSEKIKLSNISESANKVESSTTNGNIKIDGTDTTVYDDTELKNNLAQCLYVDSEGYICLKEE